VAFSASRFGIARPRFPRTSGDDAVRSAGAATVRELSGAPRARRDHLRVRPGGACPFSRPLSELQGWIFTDLPTDLGFHANRCGGRSAAAACQCADRPRRRTRRRCRRLSQIALSGEPSSDARPWLRPPRTRRSARRAAIREPPHGSLRIGSAGYTLRATRCISTMRDREGDGIADLRRRAFPGRQDPRRTARRTQAREDTKLGWRMRACGASALRRPSASVRSMRR